jgi:hypothetical protein
MPGGNPKKSYPRDLRLDKWVQRTHFAAKSPDLTANKFSNGLGIRPDSQIAKASSTLISELRPWRWYR